MTTAIVVITMGVALMFLVGAAWTWTCEHREYNGGTCRQCGTPWQSYDEDSLGCRLYRCDGGHWSWVNWSSVDGKTSRGNESSSPPVPPNRPRKRPHETRPETARAAA